MNGKKGRKNKLKIGDKVEFTLDCVNWFVTHLVDNYSQKHDCYYGREILKNFDEIAGWLEAHLSGKMPKGVVVGYGSEDDKPGFNNVRVEFKFKYCTNSGYFSEITNLKKIESNDTKKKKAKK